MFAVPLMSEETPDEVKPVGASEQPSEGQKRGRIKLEVYGEEMVGKVVGASGNSGRVYLPREWVGSRVIIIRQD